MTDQNAPIAVIEDNTPIRKLFATILSKSGFPVVEFPDGNSALASFKDNPVSTIIMDILLPDINGTELIKDVRLIDNCNNVPIIAVTGFAQTSDREKFIELGFDAYISKPINTHAFVDEVKEIRTNKFSN
jgi:two-component system, cell cycle response regulator DivK